MLDGDCFSDFFGEAISNAQGQPLNLEMKSSGAKSILKHRWFGFIVWL